MEHFCPSQAALFEGRRDGLTEKWISQSSLLHSQFLWLSLGHCLSFWVSDLPLAPSGSWLCLGLVVLSMVLLSLGSGSSRFLFRAFSLWVEWLFLSRLSGSWLSLGFCALSRGARGVCGVCGCVCGCGGVWCGVWGVWVCGLCGVCLWWCACVGCGQCGCSCGFLEGLGRERRVIGCHGKSNIE